MKKIFTIIFLLLLCGVTMTALAERSTSIVTIAGEGYYVHSVGKGETIYSLSRLYSVTEEELQSNNPQIVDGLQQGQVLKIPVVKEPQAKVSERKMNKLFDTHTVNQGETLFAISRRYEIPVSTLLEDNEGLDPTALSIGQQINIRKKSKGEASTEQIAEQMEEYRDAINSVTTDGKYHLVERGETLFGLSRKYGVSEEEIRKANKLEGSALRAGMMLKISMEAQAESVVARDSVSLTEEGVVVEDSIRRENVGIKELHGKERINVSLLLPLTTEKGEKSRSYMEFYQGVLLGMEDLKGEGISAKVSLYDTSRSEDETIIRKIVESPEFEDTDLIIGPVYEKNIAPVLRFAEQKEVAIVFPLAVMESQKSSLLYQMAPDAKGKYDKLKEQVLTPGKNIIFVTTPHKDEEMENELKPLLPQGYHAIEYTGKIKTDPFDAVIDRRGENVIIISCVNELQVDQILATISSKQNNLVARSMSNGDISIVGSARWARFQNNVDKNLYFKLKLCYIAPYHADRSNQSVRSFDSRYLKAFSAIPSLYSYRGYDAARLFIGASMERGSDLTQKLNAEREPLLQTPYHFTQQSDGDNFANDRWLMVCYNNDYTIEVK